MFCAHITCYAQLWTLSVFDAGQELKTLKKMKS